MESVRIEKMQVHNLGVLTELFDYNDVGRMMSECARDIRNGVIDIFLLYVDGGLAGELRAKYECDDEDFAVRGRRAYMYAFRIREELRNKGYGTYLFEAVLNMLSKSGYSEFTVGVEDDDTRALHIYRRLGFTELLLRRREEYQGDEYEYNLYLKK